MFKEYANTPKLNISAATLVAGFYIAIVYKVIRIVEKYLAAVAAVAYVADANADAACVTRQEGNTASSPERALSGKPRESDLPRLRY